MLLAIESIHDRVDLVHLLQLLPHAAIKPDPDRTKYKDTRDLQDIFAAVASIYELTTNGSGRENVASLDSATLGALSTVAKRRLKTRATPALARASERIGLALRTKTGFSDALVQVLRRAATSGAVTGLNLSREIRSPTLWRHCPIDEDIWITTKTGRRLVDLSHLDWERVPDDAGWQLPAQVALDKWCSKTTLDPLSDDDAYRGQGASLLRALGVPHKSAHNIMFAARNQVDTPTRQTRRNRKHLTKP